MKISLDLWSIWAYYLYMDKTQIKVGDMVKENRMGTTAYEALEINGNMIRTSAGFLHVSKSVKA